MIDSKKLLADLQKQVRLLEDDLRMRCDQDPQFDAPLRKEYDAAKAKKRTALTYKAWRDGELTQVAVAWVPATGRLSRTVFSQRTFPSWRSMAAAACKSLLGE